MTNVTIFGKGNMGSAIAGVLSAADAQIQQLDSTSTDAVTGDVVVLAVPYSALAPIAQEYGDQLKGKVVVDITNPLDFSTFELIPASDSSATAELAAALPDSSVLKAFNTNFGATLASKTIGSQPTTVLIAGNDADAKAALSELVTAAGLGALDAGPLSRARDLEAIARTQMGLAASEQISWTGGFAIVK